MKYSLDKRTYLPGLYTCNCVNSSDVSCFFEGRGAGFVIILEKIVRDNIAWGLGSYGSWKENAVVIIRDKEVLTYSADDFDDMLLFEHMLDVNNRLVKLA